MAQAIKSQGFKLEIDTGVSPTVWTEVKEVTSFNVFDGEAADIEVTHLQSTAKEFLVGLADNGNASFELNYVSTDAGQELVRAAVGGAIKTFRITLSNNEKYTFNGFVKSAPLSGGVDGKVDTSFNIKVSGAYTNA
jgi:hypothetical protein